MAIASVLTRLVPTTRLPSGEFIPKLGLGTWELGEDPKRREDEIAAIRLGLDLGMTLIDTAEMYGNGAAERLIDRALADRRDEAFLVSKVLPGNATFEGTIAACERSLQRLGTRRIDLYLLHWRGDVPLSETLDAFLTLQKRDKIRYWGVSNFDVDDMEELWALPNGSDCATNQVLYNLTRRGIEYDLMPWCLKHRLPIMAYSPIEQGRMLPNTSLVSIAIRHRATPAQIALAWLILQDGVVAIPRSGNPAHVTENRGAVEIQLTAEDLALLDTVFPQPTKKRPLEMI